MIHWPETFLDIAQSLRFGEAGTSAGFLNALLAILLDSNLKTTPSCSPQLTPWW